MVNWCLNTYLNRMKHITHTNRSSKALTVPEVISKIQQILPLKWLISRNLYTSTFNSQILKIGHSHGTKSTNLQISKFPPLIRLQNEICTKSEIQPYQWNKFQNWSKTEIKQNPPLPWNKMKFLYSKLQTTRKSPISMEQITKWPQKINHKNSPVSME